jgi:hypothetical protein
MEKRKGVALITVLVLSFIALAFVSVLLFMITRGTQVAGGEKRYISSLEVAKGVSNYLMELMDEDTFCDYVDCSKENVPVNLGSYAKFGDYEVKAVLLKKVDIPSTRTAIYAVELSVKNKKRPSEKAVVDFVYKVSP